MDQSGERECVSVKLEDFIFFFFFGWLRERQRGRKWLKEKEKRKRRNKESVFGKRIFRVCERKWSIFEVRERSREEEMEWKLE